MLANSIVSSVIIGPNSQAQLRVYLAATDEASTARTSLAGQPRRAGASVDSGLHRSTVSGDWPARSRDDRGANLSREGVNNYTFQFSFVWREFDLLLGGAWLDQAIRRRNVLRAHREHRLCSGQEFRWPALRAVVQTYVEAIEYAVPGPAISSISVAIDRHQAAAVEAALSPSSMSVPTRPRWCAGIPNRCRGNISKRVSR